MKFADRVALRNGNLLLEGLSMRKGGLEPPFLSRAKGVAQGYHRAVARHVGIEPQADHARLCAG
jgi:hypothetical protein